jgi:hypothetical protein
MADAEVPDPGFKMPVHRKHPVSAQEPIQFLHPDRVIGRHPENLDLHDRSPRAPRPLRLRSAFPPPATWSSPN